MPFTAFINISKSLHLQKCQWTNNNFLGWPRKLTVPDERNVLYALKKIYQQQLSSTAKTIQMEWGCKHLSIWPITRCLNKNEYKNWQARKKGSRRSKTKYCKHTLPKKTLPLLKRTSGNVALAFIFMVSVLSTKETPMLR